MITGSMVALVTPMSQGGQLDLEALTRLLQGHLQSTTQAIVLLGSTGEASCLSMDERAVLIKHAHAVLDGQLPLIVGTGAASTQLACEYTQQAQSLGATACLVATPAYLKPTQAGIVAHMRTIHDQSDVPLYLYHVPSRTGGALAIETVLALSKLPRIVGIKDATGDLAYASALRTFMPPEFALYSGCDSLYTAHLALGYHGVISVAANILPKAMQALSLMPKAQMWQRQRILAPFFEQLEQWVNPIGIKVCLAELGYISEGIRLPLLWPTLQESQLLRQACTPEQLGETLC